MANDVKNYNGKDFSSPLVLMFFVFLFSNFILIAQGETNSVFNPATNVVTLTAGANAQDIQKALDDLPPGGEVMLPPGVYRLAQPLVLHRSGQALRGSGASTILIVEDRANCPAVIVGAPLEMPQHSVSNMLVGDFVIDGNRVHQSVEFWQSAVDASQLNNNGIDIWNATDVKIERVVCCRCRSGGLVAAANIRRLLVDDFTAFDNQYDGLACYFTEDSHFTNLLLHDNLAAGISLDLDFNHNVIDHAVLTSNDLGVFMRQSRSNTFDALTITHSHNHGVFMAQTAVYSPDGWKLSPGTECSGNKFDNLLITNSGGNAFWVTDSACTNNFINGGKFRDNTKGGFAPNEGNLVAVHDLVIE